MFTRTSSSSTTLEPPAPPSPQQPIFVTYTWTVPCDSIKSCLYDDDDVYYQYDDYADDVKIESPAFGTAREPDKFLLRLYPRSTEGCSDAGSLVLALKSDYELRVEKLKINIAGYTRQEEKCIDGIARKSTALLAQSLGWRNTFAWKDLIRQSANLIIYCEITYHDPLQIAASTSSSSPPSRTYHQQRLSEDFSSLLARSRFSDVVLCTASGQEFPAHKAILAARSAVFDAMFSHEECSETQAKRVVIDDISAEVMEQLLGYIYSGDTGLVEKYAVELLAAADKYDIQSLIKVCVQSMLHSINLESAARLFYTADLHRLDELKLQAMEYINRNPRKVMVTDGWKMFIKPRADLIEELYGNLADQTVTGVTRFH